MSNKIKESDEMKVSRKEFCKLIERDKDRFNNELSHIRILSAIAATLFGAIIGVAIFFINPGILSVKVVATAIIVLAAINACVVYAIERHQSIALGLLDNMYRNILDNIDEFAMDMSTMVSDVNEDEVKELIKSSNATRKKTITLMDRDKKEVASIIYLIPNNTYIIRVNGFGTFVPIDTAVVPDNFENKLDPFNAHSSIGTEIIECCGEMNVCFRVNEDHTGAVVVKFNYNDITPTIIYDTVVTRYEDCTPAEE